ncbi:uncharacterized protein LOC141641960 [Silene latifolia]|uniref:uncharacterized protein LOC141641960 n=1 Tax=Silene latifolia TaxID=37657 RepID=UPI003D776103
MVKKCLSDFKFAPKHDLGNYLGLPTSIGSSKRELFKFLVEKTKRRLSSWNNILLSSAGKLTLIRSVLSSLSLFSLSVFRIPVTSKFQSLMVHFWWSGTRTNKSIHWCSKDFLVDLWEKGALVFAILVALTKPFLSNLLGESYVIREALLVKLLVSSLVLSDGPITGADRSRMSAPIVAFCKSKLWKLPISYKLRVFLWKFMANALPVGSEFLKRKMNWRSSCTLCNDLPTCVESISHLFRDCSFAKALWFGCPLGIKITGGVDLDVRIWVINWVTSRRPWPRGALNSIPGDIQVKRIRNPFPYWIVGGPGCGNVCTVKCDAAWRADRSSGMGWCLLDGDETLRNTANARSFASSALQAKGQAAIKALKWALDEGYLHVRLVTDCLALVMQVAGAEKPIASFSCIIQDIKSIASHFHYCSLSFCPRGVNRIAHNLAQEALL